MFTKKFDGCLVVAQLVGGPAVVLAILALLYREDTQRRVGELVSRGKMRDAIGKKSDDDYRLERENDKQERRTCSAGCLTAGLHLSTR